jgi:hypothetical protein
MLTDVAMYFLAIGAKVQAVLVDSVFGVVGYLREIRPRVPGR